MSKEIAINGRFLTQPITGVQRYARELLGALDQLLSNGEIDLNGRHVTCLVPSRYREDSVQPWCKIQLQPGGILGGNLWEQIDLAWLARSKTLFSPGNIGPAALSGQVVVVHDASVFAFPRAYSPFFRFKYWLVLSILKNTAAQIVTVSEFSRVELARYCHIPKDQMAVVPPGSNHLERLHADGAALKRYHLGEKPYLLTVGSNSAHKNFGLLSAALRMSGRKDIEVVRVGRSNRWLNPDPTDALAENLRTIGAVDDCELRALYEHAAAFVFPSKYEGFGLPVLEAMSFGCPVICSQAAAIPEVGGDAVLYFDPNRADVLQAQIERVLGDRQLQITLREKGLARAKLFQWDQTARRMWEIIREKS